VCTCLYLRGRNLILQASRSRPLFMIAIVRSQASDWTTPDTSVVRVVNVAKTMPQMHNRIKAMAPTTKTVLFCCPDACVAGRAARAF